MIALFDSGVGGLSILQAVRERLPTADLVYLADTANFPYGSKTATELQQVALQNLKLLQVYQPNLIVAACNTASTAALEVARQKFPQLPVVGVVPAVKPAVAATRSGIIGVCATAATLQSAAYTNLKRTHGAAVTFLDRPSPEWVRLVEAGAITGQRAEEAVMQVLDPLLAGGADVIVLACTHFPFLRPLIEHVVDDEVIILDSGQAVAQQVERVVPQTAMGSGQTTYLCSGDSDGLIATIKKLTGQSVDVARV